MHHLIIKYHLHDSGILRKYGVFNELAANIIYFKDFKRIEVLSFVTILIFLNVIEHYEIIILLIWNDKI